MTITQVLIYFSTWSFIGVIAFSLIVVYLFRSGRVYDSRTKEGHFKQKIELKGLISITSFLILVVMFLTISNFLSLIRSGAVFNCWHIFSLNLGLITILILYDTLVIDWIVIAHWRPAFLRLPDAMNKVQMLEHVRRTVQVAPFIAILVATLSSTVTCLIW